VGVGPKKKWLGQEIMLGDQDWVEKKLNSHGGWVKNTRDYNISINKIYYLKKTL
jgi:hypothetical protein